MKHPQNEYHEETGLYYYDTSTVYFKWSHGYVKWLEQKFNILNQVSGFSLGMCPLYNREVYIIPRGQIDGPDKWVCMLENSNGWCLGKNNRWYYERNPSRRTEAFIKQTRFDTHQEAREAYQKHLKKGKVHKLTL